MPRFVNRAARLVAISFATMASGCSHLYLPIDSADVSEMSETLIDALTVVPEPLSQPLTVEEAVRRSVLHNHSARAKELEAALAIAQVRAQSAEMLPRLAAEADFSRRNRPSLTRSTASQNYSTSSEVSNVASDITLSWNILDFGLSLLRMSQGMDNAHQQQAEALRLRNRIIEETRSIYWRAVAEERLERGIAQLEPEMREALRLARVSAKDDSLEPMAAINLQRDILNLQRDLNQVLAGLAGARDQLKQSIGLPLFGNIKLAAQRREASPTKTSIPASEDIAAVLQRRPEIRQVMYEMRITEREATAAVLKVLPGVSLDIKAAADSNIYLLHSNWMSWGARVAGNITAIVMLPNELDAIEAKQEVHRQNALATAALVVMQVHVSRARLTIQTRARRDAENASEVQRQLLRQAKAAAEAGKVGADSVVREKLATLLAETRAIVAFADWQAAVAAYEAATGRLPEDFAQFEEKSRS
jgi:outer membrane protein TolC